MPFLIFALLMWLILKCTGLLFRIIGKALSLTFGVIGYILLAKIKNGIVPPFSYDSRNFIFGQSFLTLSSG